MPGCGKARTSATVLPAIAVGGWAARESVTEVVKPDPFRANQPVTSRVTMATQPVPPLAFGARKSVRAAIPQGPVHRRRTFRTFHPLRAAAKSLVASHQSGHLNDAQRPAIRVSL